jgi:hypothetical protein
MKIESAKDLRIYQKDYAFAMEPFEPKIEYQMAKMSGLFYNF